MADAQRRWMADATAFWGLSSAGLLSAVLQLAPGRVGTTPAVVEELRRNGSERPFLAAALALISSGEVHVVEPLTYREISLALDLRKLWLCSPRDRDNLGEAEVIAVASERGFGVVLDDRRARRTVGLRFPNVETLDTPHLLLYLVEAGHLTMDAAWDGLTAMSQIGEFSHAFADRPKAQWMSKRDYPRMPAL